MFANEDSIQVIKDNFSIDIINLARDMAEYFKEPPYAFMLYRDTILLEEETKNALIQVTVDKNKHIELMCLSKYDDNSNSMKRLNSFIINNQVYNNEFICRRIKDISKI